MKKTIIILSIILVICLTGTIFLFLHSQGLQMQILQDEQIYEKLAEDLTAQNAKKEKIKKENATLKAEAIKIVDLKDEAEKTAKKMQADHAKLSEELKEKDGRIEELFKLYEEYEKSNAAEAAETLGKTVNRLNSEIKNLKKVSAKEKSIFYYNLGVVYTQAKLYDRAIEVYQKSLKINENNPEANFNLGLIYQNQKKTPEIAVIYYRKYLELKPDAADKKKVQQWLSDIYKETGNL